MKKENTIFTLILKLYYIPASLILLPLTALLLLHLNISILFPYILFVVLTAVYLWFYAVIKSIVFLKEIEPKFYMPLRLLLILWYLAGNVLYILRYFNIWPEDSWFTMTLYAIEILSFLIFIILLMPQINKVIIGRSQIFLFVELITIVPAILNLSPLFLEDLDAIVEKHPE